MIIKGLKWCSTYGGWGDTFSQVEFSDGEHTRFITVSEFDSEWIVFITDEDIIEAMQEDDFDPDDVQNKLDGEMQELLPQIVKSPYGPDICIAMRTLDYFPGFDHEDEWETAAKKYIGPFIGRESKDIL